MQARAACMGRKPDLLLLDEPSSGLDPDGQLEMRELIKTLKNAGKTIDDWQKEWHAGKAERDKVTADTLSIFEGDEDE